MTKLNYEKEAEEIKGGTEDKSKPAKKTGTSADKVTTEAELEARVAAIQSKLDKVNDEKFKDTIQKELDSIKGVSSSSPPSPDKPIYSALLGEWLGVLDNLFKD